MADDGPVRTESVTKPAEMQAEESKHNAPSSPEIENESFSRPGAQLADKVTFKTKKGSTISGYPVIVDFRRLLQLSADASPSTLKELGIIPGMLEEMKHKYFLFGMSAQNCGGTISNRDLLHAVIGLYDVSLSEMTPDVLYSTVCEKWARTVILVRDLQETIDELEESRKTESSETEEKDKDKDELDDEDGGNGSVKESEASLDEDVYEPDDAEPCKFADVYSDTESEDEDDEEEDEGEEDYSRGINAFISSVVERRKARKSCDGPITAEMVGIENRIIGCATIEKKYVKHKDRVVHLTVISVRKRCRGFGIGKYILSQLVEPKVVGLYDAVVVHADNDAIEFFQKFGFSDDIVLNSRWKDLAEQFTNCTLMCYLPGFTGHRLLSTIKAPGIEMYELEQELLKWKEKTLEVYQQQVTCMMRMKHEVIQLKYTTQLQDKFLKTMVEENEQLKTDKIIAEKEFLDYRLQTAKFSFGTESKSKGQGAGENDSSTRELIDKLTHQVNKMDLQLKHKRTSSRDLMEALNHPNSGSVTVIDESRYFSFTEADEGKMTEEPYDHIKDSAFFYDITEQFKRQMLMDNMACKKCEVSTISKALVPEKKKKAYKEHVQKLKDPLMVMDLYFCGSLEHPERLKDILRNGFSDKEFSCGEYGKGLYFSKYPSKAAHFSKLGSLLKAEVAIGNAETVVKEDRTRTAPSSGHDSIITPGRLGHTLGQGDATMNQEYVIFNACQALPLCLLTYETG